MGVSDDRACFTDPVTVASFDVFTDARSYIIASNECINCNLQGIDLSAHDLADSTFTNTSFVQANFTNTVPRRLPGGACR